MNSNSATEDDKMNDSLLKENKHAIESDNKEAIVKNVMCSNDRKVEIEDQTESQKPLIFRVNEVPPFHLTLVFALQQALLVISAPLSVTLIIAEIVCMQTDESLKLQVLSATMFMVGMSTFLMTTFGVRLPIFQGPANSYIIPLLAMTSLKEWACPDTFKELDPATNQTVVMAYLDNNTTIPAKDLALGKISELSGSLMVAGLVHFLIGVTGLVGFLNRFIGPITIVPTIIMIGLNIFKMVVKFIEPNIAVAFVVVACNIIFSLLLGKKQTPVPWYTIQKGFHIFWFPLHNVFSILLSMLIGWAMCGILTVSGSLTDNPEDKGYLARTDARNFIIEQSNWFMIPYPGKISSFTISPGVFANFLMASLLSVLDSIGDYAASARMARVIPPPHYAFNRGIAVEGIMSFFAGTMGCCTATVSFGSNIGAMGITRVVSRRVFQVVGVLFIIASVVGKIGAFFITIPYPVLGGTTLITIGIFIGVVLSYLQTIDLSSTRNLAIIGISMLLGLVMPYWVSRNSQLIDTGIRSLDVVIQMLLSNPSFIAGFFACLTDNIIPGTMKERGLLHQMKDLDEGEANEKSDSFYQDGPEVYRLPFIPRSLRQSRLARKLLPIFDYEIPGRKQNEKNGIL